MAKYSYEVAPQLKYGKPGYAVIRKNDKGAKKTMGIWESKESAQSVKTALAGAASEEM